MWPPSSVRRSGFAQSWGVLPARVLGRSIVAAGCRCKAVPGRGGKAVPPLQPGFPRRNADVETSVAIFDAAQKVRKSPGTLAGDGDLGDLEEIRVGSCMDGARGARGI